MRILRNYVLEEMSGHFVVSLLVMTFLLLVGNVFTKMMDLVINRGVDLVHIFQLFLFTTPFIFVFTLPMALVLSVLFVFGRLSGDHELTAMKASGIHLFRVIGPILIVSVMLSLLSLYIQDQVASKSHFRVRQISAEIGLQTPAALLEEGVFIKSFKNIVLFIHKINGNELSQIRIYEPQPYGPTRTIIAERGELIPLPEMNMIKLKLEDGISDEPDKNNPGRFYKLKFGTYFLPLDISQFKSRGPIEKKRQELTIRELWQQHQKLRREGFFDPYTLTEIHKKIAIACSPFFLVFMAIPLAIRSQRAEYAIGIGIAIILSGIYWTLLLGAATALSKTSTIHPAFAMHLPNTLFFIMGLFLQLRLMRS